MKRCICLSILLFVGIVACGSNSSVGSSTFVANELVIEGNPSVIGEAAGATDAAGGYVTIGGIVDSQLNLDLTGLSVSVRVLSAEGSLLGSGVSDCSPSEVGPGGSTTFQLRVFLADVSYTTSRSLEITPVSAQGTGTVRTVALQWE